MNIVKSAFACAAAAGLLASQVAVAAPAPADRAPSLAGPAEQLGGGFPDGSAPVIAIISLLALVALIAVLTDDDDDGAPVSP